jgi:hypothetical protein
MLKQRVCVRALLLGNTIKINGYTYRLFSPGETVTFPSGNIETSKYFLAIEMTRERESLMDTVYVGSDMTFDQLLNEVEKFPLSRIEKIRKEIHAHRN